MWRQKDFVSPKKKRFVNVINYLSRYKSLKFLTMYYFFNLILLYWISSNKLTIGLVDVQSIRSDLESFTKSCADDKCLTRLGDSLQNYNCHCDVHCVQFDTCCLDSRYVNASRPKLKPSCIPLHNSLDYYFMVDRCPTSDSDWESQCREEISIGDSNVLWNIAPVTSSVTSVTYKNYYCFKCHETHDEVVYWGFDLMQILFNGSVENEMLKYENERLRFELIIDNGKTTSSSQDGTTHLYARALVRIPNEVQPLLKRCVPDIIMNCSTEWTDAEMGEKCRSYMNINEVRRDGCIFLYKNMHCALCNFEYLDDITCRTHDSVGSGNVAGGEVPFSST